MFGSIIGSQSRYVMQQKRYHSVNGLVNNTDNRYGIVDSSNRVSRLRAINHSLAGVGLGLTQAVVGNQPILNTDYWGVGKHALYFDGSKSLIGTNPLFYPTTTTQFWIAGVFKNNTGGFRIPFGIGELSVNRPGTCILLYNGKLFIQQRAYIYGDTGSETSKSISTNRNDLQDNNKHRFIALISGEDNMTNYRIWIDKNDEPLGYGSDPSYVGKTFAPGFGVQGIRFGTNVDGNNPFVGYFGGLLIGYGFPNVEVIDNSLMSTL